MIGTQIDQYEIKVRIGGGGMGEVYRATDLELDRDVAIKCVRPELTDLEEVTARFRTEARTLAKLAHLNIATVYRFFAQDDQLFLVMEYIDGSPFGEILKKGGAVPPEEAVQLMQQALAGLGYAHENDVVHRDIKPGNLMVDQQGSVKVLDFGIAHLMGGTRLTRAGSVVGTPAYMAPEQVLGKKVDPRTDLYSLGIVLFEMLSGHLPYEANSDYEIMRAHVEEVPRNLTDMSSSAIPDALQDTVARALHKDSDERYQSAAEFSAALADSLGNTTVMRPAPPIPQGTANNETTVAATADDASITQAMKPLGAAIKRQARPSQMLFGAAVALLIVLVAWLGLSPSDEPPPSQVAASQSDTFQSDSSRSDSFQSDGPASDPTTGTTLATDALPTQMPQSLAANGDETTGDTEDVSGDIGAGTGAVDRGVDGGVDSGAAIVATDAVRETNTTVAAVRREAEPVTTAPAAVAPQPKPAAPVRRPAPVTSSYPKVTPIKVSVHEKQGSGRFSRAAGFNGAFRLATAVGGSRNVEIQDVLEVRRDGVLLFGEPLETSVRTPGQFKLKTRVQRLKELEPGEYDLRLSFRHQGREIGNYDWRLTVEADRENYRCINHKVSDMTVDTESPHQAVQPGEQQRKLVESDGFEFMQFRTVRTQKAVPAFQPDRHETARPQFDLFGGCQHPGHRQCGQSRTPQDHIQPPHLGGPARGVAGRIMLVAAMPREYVETPRDHGERNEQQYESANGDAAPHPGCDRLLGRPRQSVLDPGGETIHTAQPGVTPDQQQCDAKEREQGQQIGQQIPKIDRNQRPRVAGEHVRARRQVVAELPQMMDRLRLIVLRLAEVDSRRILLEPPLRLRLLNAFGRELFFDIRQVPFPLDPSRQPAADVTPA